MGAAHRLPSSAAIKKLEADNNLTITGETDLTSLVSVPDLRRAHQFLSEKVKSLQETLSAPQRRYQRYVQVLSDLTAKMAAVMGEDENPKPGTIKDIKNRIRYIENDLTAKLDAKRADRDNIARSIFEAKTKVRAFY